MPAMVQKVCGSKSLWLPGAKSFITMHFTHSHKTKICSLHKRLQEFQKDEATYHEGY